jgi:hypothetical protein
MSDEPSPQFGILKFADSDIQMSPIPMNIVYFDSAPSLSHMNGIIGITLVVTGNVPFSDKGVANVASVVAHLKCNIPAAMALRDSLNSALLLAQPVEKPEGKAN